MYVRNYQLQYIFFGGGGGLGPDQHFLTGRIRIRTKMVDGKNMLEFMASLLAHRYENILFNF